MAIKAISQFDAATPTSNDKILFEQNGEGKSTTFYAVSKAIGINMDNLWTNSSPASPFESQTIPLDLTEYRYVKIMFKRTASINEVFFQDCFLGYTTICMLGSNAFGFRKLKVTNSGIEFGDFFEYGSYNGSEATAYSQYGVPLIILGVK